MTADEGLVMPHREAVVVCAVDRRVLQAPGASDTILAAIRAQADAFLAETGYRYADEEVTVDVYDPNPLDLPGHNHPDVPLGCVMVRATFDTVQLPTAP